MKIKRELLITAAFFLVGAALRLSFPGDIEYKGDENAFFHTVWNALHGGDFPKMGMNSGVGILNPPVSFWIFIAAGWIFGANDPVELARAVQLTNCIAMGALLLFIFRCVPKKDRELWLWGAAIVFLNPFQVLFDRKIWPQSIFPLFSVLTLIGWWHRERRWGAFLWGLVGGLLGQIHMGGGFPLALAYFVGTLVVFRGKGIAWWFWIAGSALAAIPLLGWMGYMVNLIQTGIPPNYHDFFVNFSMQAHPLSSWMDRIPGQFFWLWITGVAGFGMDYSFHHQVWDFLSSFGGVPWLATATSGAAVLFVLLTSLKSPSRIFGWDAPRNGTALFILITFACFGVLFTLLPFFAHRHYLLALFPAPGLWFARLAILGKKRWSLFPLCAGLFILSVCLLGYIHRHGGAPGGDYGVAYSAQH